jgi:hypothetical protein
LERKIIEIRTDKTRKQGVDMKIFIRSEAQETAAAVLETIAS